MNPSPGVANPGMLTVDQLSKLVRSNDIDTVLVVFTDLYGRFMGKRFDADYFLQEVTQHGTHGCDYLVTADMEMEPVPGYEYANWERGYGDFHMMPDLKTLRVASWLNRTAMVICNIEDDKSHSLVPYAPRALLLRAIDQANYLGFSAMAATELEYYLYRDSYRTAAQKNYTGLEAAGWYIEDYHILQGTRVEDFNGAVRRHLKHSGVPVENSKGEWGLGQHELNVRYADILVMADRHAVYKQCLKEVAEQMGISVTFMAKVDANQAGSSCHIHLSLWRDGRNAFAGSKTLGPLQVSDTFRFFLGGWLHHLPAMMPFYAPNVNSYKRYQAGSWAPTRIAWSHDNRTAGFRVVGRDQTLRIECRVPGADCNPYMALAAGLLSGLDGIANQIEPPPIFSGDVYSAQNLPYVPPTLRHAIANLKASPFARRMLGEAVLNHYVHFFEIEQIAYDKAVTDWERKRYFERI
jgi:glutamine synthetase